MPYHDTSDDVFPRLAVGEHVLDVRHSSQHIANLGYFRILFALPVGVRTRGVTGTMGTFAGAGSLINTSGGEERSVFAKNIPKGGERGGSLEP